MHFILSALILAYTAHAASTCSTILQGNLSPNGISGNFELVASKLAFDETNISTAFNVQLQSCSGFVGDSASCYLVAPNGKCLAVDNSQVVSVDCENSSFANDLTWTYTSGFLFWSGPTSSCSSGLYGYQAVGGGVPEQLSPTPITIVCESASGAYPFSLLI